MTQLPCKSSYFLGQVQFPNGFPIPELRLGGVPLIMHVVEEMISFFYCIFPIGGVLPNDAIWHVLIGGGD